ncbi:MAG: NAD-dependent epimerase/dehydratase family protein [Methanoregula sp.]
MNKILVTGGAGFIGYTISKILAEDPNNEIHIIDNFSKDRNDEDFKRLIKKNNVTFFNKDLTDQKTYTEIDDHYHQIYHLAATVGVKTVTDNPVETLKNNSFSTLFLLEYLKGMKKPHKILFTSSCENYAGSITCCNVKIPTPENVPLCIEDIFNPRWTYAISKILGESACIHYAKQYHFDAAIIRYHNVFGPRMGTEHVIPEFFLRLKKNARQFEMYGGDQYRTFCYCTDAAKMTINVMNSLQSSGRIINIGNDKNNIKISDIGKQLAKIMKINPEFIENGAPDGSVKKRIPDLSVIKKMNCYVEEVPFEEGLAETYRWYNERY